MNLYHLRYFVTLGHMQHYTNAAKRLCITEPSLSNAINGLEKELGTKLFKKSGRNVILTKQGKSFLNDTDHALKILDRGVERLQAEKVSEKPIDIALLRTLSTSLVPELVRAFLDNQTNEKSRVRFHNDSGLTLDIINGLKERKYDVGFCSKVTEEKAIEFFPISRQELVLIVPADHPLAKYKAINLTEALPYPQILFAHRSGLRRIIDEMFEQVGGQPIVAYEVEEDETIAGLVANHFGIAIVPNMPVLKQLDVKVIKISFPKWERAFYMAILKDVYHSPGTIDLIAFIKSHAKL